MTVEDLLKVSYGSVKIYAYCEGDPLCLLCKASDLYYDEMKARKSFAKLLEKREKNHERALCDPKLNQLPAMLCL